jgi:UDP-N-acetylglucosamine transferase subunit ALG13|tara:strand:- start:18542 stop:20128 length:1587 start_codon:yes stop_codon:yes gene_type:complete
MTTQSNKKKYIIYYIVSEKHIENFLRIKDFFHNHDFIVVYDQVLDKKILRKYNENFQELNDYFYKFMNKYKYKISIIYFSTTQARYSSLNLVYNCFINNIPTIAIQETHQFYLHNEELNNYILPIDKIFVNSKFEEKIFLNYGYRKSNINVVGWGYNVYYKQKFELIYDKKIILILLNASKDINVISIEDAKHQISLINKIYSKLGNSYKIIVKLHPSELKKNYCKIKNSINENISIFLNEYNSNALIKNSEFIFSTGYTQSILEAILLNKKIILIPNEKNMNLLEDTNNYIVDYNKLEYLMKNYNYDELEKIAYVNDIYLVGKNFDENFIKYSTQLINNYNNHFKIYNLIETSLWFSFFNKDQNAIKILNYLNKKNAFQYSSIIRSLKNFYNNKYDYRSLIDLFDFFEKTNTFFVYKYLVIRKLYKKINFNPTLIKYLLIEEPKYLFQIFFNDRQRWLNLLIYKNKINLFKKLFTKDYSENYKFFNSKSIKFKLYVLLRKNIFLLSFFPFYKKINLIIFDIFINDRI